MSEDVFIDMLEDDDKPEAQVLAAATCYAALADIAKSMEAEAEQFSMCCRRHERRGNNGASAVADRARLRLSQFAAAVRQCQHSNTNG